MLLSMGWTSVRHSREEKWPIILEEAIEEFSTPSSPLSPVTSSSFSSHTLLGEGIGSNYSSVDSSELLLNSPLKNSSMTMSEDNGLMDGIMN